MKTMILIQWEVLEIRAFYCIKAKIQLKIGLFLIIWQCNHKFKNEEKCKTLHIYKDDLKAAFLKAFDSLLENRDEILAGYEAIIETLTDTSKLVKENANLQSKCEVVAELVRKRVEENAATVMNQQEYQERYTGLVERYEEIKLAIEDNMNKRQERNAKKKSIKDFMRMIEKNDILLDGFDEEVWNATIENVLVFGERKKMGMDYQRLIRKMY
jgi:hypothetical protein